MARLKPERARSILIECEAHGANYHALPARAVAALLGHADRHKYRKARNAPGSRARMWHEYLVRLADKVST